VRLSRETGKTEGSSTAPLVVCSLTAPSGFGLSASHPFNVWCEGAYMLALSLGGLSLTIVKSTISVPFRFWTASFLITGVDFVDA
jgi:hypothetical protein